MSTRERIGTEIGLMTGRIKKTFRNSKESLAGMQSNVAGRTRKVVRRTDYYVHDNAWTMMALSAGLAFAAGFLLSRRSQESLALEYQEGEPEVHEKIRKVSSWDFFHSVMPLALFAVRAFSVSRKARKY